MIDLHCHLLPGIDDGAPNLETALAMARIAVADGIRFTACTPHVYPGVYDNNAAGIRVAVERLRQDLAGAGIDLALGHGADVHLSDDLVGRLRRDEVPTLHGSRYFLLEFPNRMPWPAMRDASFTLMARGYLPVITHPERQGWIDDHWADLVELLRQGVWLQVTGGSFLGHFGRTAKYWAEKLAGEGWIHLLASDAHNTGRRAPQLAEARRIVARWVGAEEAARLVLDRPQAILDNRAPDQVTPPPGLAPGGEKRVSLWRRALRRLW